MIYILISKIIFLTILFLILFWHSTILIAMYKAENQSHIPPPKFINALITLNLFLLITAIFYIIFQF
jgi:hypothetical protein